MSNETLTIYQVDAFTNELFKGNPAGVCIIDRELDTDLMQNIALEMNLSETAFVRQIGTSFEIRYFTPEIEVPLCGHATLGSSHILYSTGLVGKNEKIVFIAKAGELIVKKEGDWITMNFPQYFLNKIDTPSAFEQITSVRPIETYESERGWKLFLLNSEDDVANISPNFELLKQHNLGHTMVTAKSVKPGVDYVHRCFAPDAGINEDPVTGSAQCALGPFWKMKTGKSSFIANQLSKRTGVLKVNVLHERVEISGQAVTVFKADFNIRG